MVSLKGQMHVRPGVLGTYLVTHMVLWHWLTSVSLSSSLCGRTVMSSSVLGLAQNSLLTGSTRLLVQLARLMRPRGFWETEERCSILLTAAPRGSSTQRSRVTRIWRRNNDIKWIYFLLYCLSLSVLSLPVSYGGLQLQLLLSRFNYVYLYIRIFKNHSKQEN